MWATASRDPRTLISTLSHECLRRWWDTLITWVQGFTQGSRLYSACLSLSQTQKWSHPLYSCFPPRCNTTLCLFLYVSPALSLSLIILFRSELYFKFSLYDSHTHSHAHTHTHTKTLRILSYQIWSWTLMTVVTLDIVCWQERPNKGTWAARGDKRPHTESCDARTPQLLRNTNTRFVSHHDKDCGCSDKGNAFYAKIITFLVQ